MSDIDSSLPIKTLNTGATGPADVVVGLYDANDIRVSPLDIAGFTAGLEVQTAGLTAALEAQTEGITGALEVQTAGITGALSDQTDSLTTALETQTAGITSALDSQTTSLESALETQTAGITGALESQTAGITGALADISAQLPAELGATAASGSLSVTIATDQTAIPVYQAPSALTPIVEFTREEAVAYAAGVTGSYSPANDFYLNRVQASASGRMKVEVFAGAIAGWAYDDTRRKWVNFNSTSNPNIDINCKNLKLTGGSDKVEVLAWNYEKNTAQDLYFTIVGDEE